MSGSVHCGHVDGVQLGVVHHGWVPELPLGKESRQWCRDTLPPITLGVFGLGDVRLGAKALH